MYWYPEALFTDEQACHRHFVFFVCFSTHSLQSARLGQTLTTCVDVWRTNSFEVVHAYKRTYCASRTICTYCTYQAGHTVHASL